MTKTRQLTRRSFLRNTLGSAAIFSIVPRHVLGGPGYIAPSEQLTKAIIGVGGMGRNHIDYKGSRLLAICDVDEVHLREAGKLAGAEVARYKDYREVLARPDVDIVHIVTPPHWHGLMAIDAAYAGKDIWCEKPMTRTIGEGQAVVRAVQRTGRMFRLNTWFRFEGNFYGLGTTVRPLKKLIDSGMLGWPLTVTVGATTGFDWKLQLWQGRTHLPTRSVPAQLDYEQWLGPAPWKPYHPHRVHQSFRGYWDYDGGGLGDMGMHYLDPVQYLLGKDDESPVAVEVDTVQQHPDAVLPWRRIEARYADGCKIILDGEGTDHSLPYIEGPEGKLYRGFRSDIPDLRKKLTALPDPEPQQADFFDSVRRRRTFALNEQNGHRSCTFINLCKIALRVRRPLKFDSDAQRFINDEQANRLIESPMRAPWNMQVA